MTVLSVGRRSKAHDITGFDFIEDHFVSGRRNMMAFVDDHLPVLINQIRNQIVLFINQALIGGDINLPARSFLPTANNSHFYATDKRA